MSIKSKLRKAGKIALALGCPPVALGAFVGKSLHNAGESKKSSIGLGVCLGIASSAPIFCLNSISSELVSGNKLYDNPDVITSFEPTNFANFGARFILSLSPLLTESKVTRLPLEDEVIKVIGRDVIEFNESTMLYELNFSPDRDFKIARKGIPFSLFYSSVEDCKEAVDNLHTMRELDKMLLVEKIDNLSDKGKIFEARRAGMNLGLKLSEYDARISEAQEIYENRREEYERAREVFQEAVDKMNSELVYLRGEQK